MGADQDDLVGEVGARKLGDDVRRRHGVPVEGGLEIELELDVDVTIEKTQDPVVLLGGHRHVGYPVGTIWPTVSTAAPHPDDAVGAGRHVHQRDDTFLLEKGGENRPELPLLDATSPPPSAVPFLGDLHLFERGQAHVVVTLEHLLRRVDLGGVVE